MSRDVFTKQEELTYLSSYISKQIKKKFGKGPEACYTSISDQYVVINIKKFMTQIESELIRKDEHLIAQTIRSTIMKDLLSPLIDTLQEMFGKLIATIYQDWNFHNNTGILIGIFQEKQQFKNDGDHIEFQILKDEFMKQSETSIFRPENISVDKINIDTVVIKCSDLLMPIEKMMIDKGYVHILQEREQIIRNRFRSNKSRFERILSKDLEDIYLIWDYENNNSYTIFSGK
ncbi:Na-translocating system protein MpsC family protein [Ferdinandcohnia quinoae]|uniref:DUF2294 domain-containing protein n=1 Tax=Fredinandcohnia quinoae TaxID=2918902 RepID=A0AAW5E582_9BACI|nr:Na-translocating system protein MpsC family protein [Fredinandcohnia sp. SECRCQ15]MCH1624258.1 DUF2294 domain-containing protein [Fredinandcohnia sp. SECRCQ15]